MDRVSIAEIDAEKDMVEEWIDANGSSLLIIQSDQSKKINDLFTMSIIILNRPGLQCLPQAGGMILLRNRANGTVCVGLLLGKWTFCDEAKAFPSGHPPRPYDRKNLDDRG